ncbi:MULTISPECIES: bile acid:sodium symporter family protein [unclassified Agarivorans]|uniref:bile acid:sodium symporter family protein n=1 Tax=unclassified Agarivorans TaxID=2636026 RepID=UPI003D7D795B
MMYFRWIKKEWFLLGMLFAIVLALLVPQWGRSGGYLHLDQLTAIGIALIFFLHGLGLAPKEIKKGLFNWRLHLMVQATTFVVYPLLWVLFGDLLHALLPSALAFGFCYLFALPSTISSSVAMTSIAQGNVAGAVFNASLSSLLGVFITPLLVQLFMGGDGGAMDLMATVSSICQLLLLPMIIGQALRPLLLSLFQRYKGILNKIDKLVILLIVFNAFSDSVVEHIWGEFSPRYLLFSFLISLLVLLSVVHSIRLVARLLDFNSADEIAAVFCGSKKTLAAGVPMAKVIFSANPDLGMLLLPIMLYHPIQIFYCALLANRYAAAEKVKDLHQPVARG